MFNFPANSKSEDFRHSANLQNKRKKKKEIHTNRQNQVKIKHEEKVLKTAREKLHIADMTTFQPTAGTSSETMETSTHP